MPQYSHQVLTKLQGDNHLAHIGGFPDFIKNHGLQQLGKEPSPFNDRFGGTLWEVLERDPGMKQVFDRHFSLRAQKTHYNIWDICPVARMLQHSFADVTLVDIGGGRGHDLAALIQQHPHYAGKRLVLQDLPHTIEGIAPDALPPNVEKRAYDFFSGPQPVKGAAAYFMHDIIHDHDDEKASIILRHTAQSMAQTSRLLIAEWVIRDQNAQKTACSTDWIMMLLTSGGMERSLSHWTSLLEGEGLQIVKVWNGQEEGQSVIEAVLGPV